jgi:hypothetical protein
VAYNDIQNKNSQYNSYCLNTEDNQPIEQRISVNVEQREQPGTIRLLSHQLKEIKQSKSQVIFSYLNNTNFSDTQNNNCYVLPFFSLMRL